MSPLKHAAKHTPEQDARKDLRRTYAHLGRVEGIGSLTGDTLSARIVTLVELAKIYLTAKMPKEGGRPVARGRTLQLLGFTNYSKVETRVATKVEESLMEEFEKLSERAEDHRGEHEGEQSDEVAKVFKVALEEATSALSKHKFRQALELALGVEALAHIHKRPYGKKTLRLKAS